MFWDKEDEIILRIVKKVVREDGFKDTRSKNCSRPSTKDLSLEEQLE